MKELIGLKLGAIAVTIPMGCEPVLVKPSTAGVEMIYLQSNGTINSTAYEYLPPGEWKILGRADELFITKSSNHGILDFLHEHGWRDYDDKTPDAWCMKTQTQSWQSYCTEHGLTNELILVKESLK